MGLDVGIGTEFFRCYDTPEAFGVCWLSLKLDVGWL